MGLFQKKWRTYCKAKGIYPGGAITFLPGNVHPVRNNTSTNNQNITVTHIFANSLKNSNNNYNSNINNENKRKKNNSNKISFGNTLNNTAFSTINKNNRQSKFNSKIIQKNNNIKSNNEEIIYNDYDGEDEDNFKFDIKNINTDILLRLREFLLSCDLL